MHNRFICGWHGTVSELPLLGQAFAWWNGLIYYTICAALFLFMGLALGHFIWRRGLLQTFDLQQEVRRAEQELENIKEEVAADEKELL